MPAVTTDLLWGNSGGPICDLKGQLTGLASGGEKEFEYGMGYITTCEATKRIVEELDSKISMKGSWLDACKPESKNLGVVLSQRILWIEPGGSNIDAKTSIGQSVEILETAKVWNKIRLSDGIEGWVSSKSIQKCP